MKKISLIDWVGIVYFATMLALSFSLAKERLMMDGAFLIFDMLSYGGFPGLQNRLIVVLTEFLPLFSIELGLSFKYVLWSYIVNEWAYYLIIFLLLRFWLKDKWASWFLIVLYTATVGSNYFIIVEGLSPGASFIVLFLSVIKNRPLDRATGYILAFVLFFIAFSHPMVSISFIISGGFYTFYHLLNGKAGLIALLKPYKKVIVLAVIFFTLRFLMAILDPYESERGSALGLEKLQSVLLLFSKPVIFDLIKMYLFGFTTVAAAFLISIIIFFKKRDYLKGSLFFLFCFGYLLFIAFYVDISQPYYFNIENQQLGRWIFPLHFLIILVFFIEVLLPYWAKPQKRVWVVPFLLIFFIGINIYTIERISLRPRRTVVLYDYLLEKAEKLEGSKFYIKMEVNDDYSYTHHGNFADYIIISLLRESKPTKQIITARDIELDFLLTYHDDSLFLNNGNAFDINQLNERNYFQLEPGPYLELPHTKEGFNQYINENYPKLRSENFY